MLNKRDERFFNAAAAQASQSDFAQQMGAVIVFKNKIISAGHNQTKTHPFQARYDKERPQIIDGLKNAHCLHAECAALIKCINMDIDWSRAEVYVYRKMRARAFGLAKPCPSCEKMLRDKGIRRVHYTTNHNSYVCEDFE